MIDKNESIELQNQRSLKEFEEMFASLEKRRVVEVPMFGDIPDRFSRKTITKSELERDLFHKEWAKTDHDMPEKINGWGAIGLDRHKLISKEVKKRLGQRQKIVDSRIYKRLAMDQLLHEGEFSSQSLGKKLDENSTMVDKVWETFGSPKEYYDEVKVTLPVHSRRDQGAGYFETRVDAIVVGEKTRGIVEYKTGAIFEEKEVLFNLGVMAIVWATIGFGKYRVKWGGKRIECQSPNPLARLPWSPETTFAIIWPEKVVTNWTFGFRDDEFDQFTYDINEIMVQKLAI